MNNTTTFQENIITYNKCPDCGAQYKRCGIYGIQFCAYPIVACSPKPGYSHCNCPPPNSYGGLYYNEIATSPQDGEFATSPQECAIELSTLDDEIATTPLDSEALSTLDSAFASTTIDIVVASSPHVSASVSVSEFMSNVPPVEETIAPLSTQRHVLAEDDCSTEALARSEIIELSSKRKNVLAEDDFNSTSCVQSTKDDITEALARSETIELSSKRKNVLAEDDFNSTSCAQSIDDNILEVRREMIESSSKRRHFRSEDDTTEAPLICMQCFNEIYECSEHCLFKVGGACSPIFKHCDGPSCLSPYEKYKSGIIPVRGFPSSAQ